MSDTKRVRTRFAPSPTGYMHIGNLRTALYAYLLTKHMGGDYILRIEDTDQERYVDGAVDLIYRTLKETGIKHDEGPDVGGEYGPYIQSERRNIYKEETLDFNRIMDEQERRLIAYALKKEGSTRKAADFLNIPQTTFSRKKLKHHL